MNFHPKQANKRIGGQFVNFLMLFYPNRIEQTSLPVYFKKKIPIKGGGPDFWTFYCFPNLRGFSRPLSPFFHLITPPVCVCVCVGGGGLDLSRNNNIELNSNFTLKFFIITSCCKTELRRSSKCLINSKTYFVLIKTFTRTKEISKFCLTSAFTELLVLRGKWKWPISSFPNIARLCS